MRVALGLEYDGSGFSGWQVQRGVRTVQASLEQAIGKVANQAVRVFCAGRTDTGVHAIGQVVHFETDAVRSLHSWVLGVNANLPPDVAVVWATVVPEDFHARYSAQRRRYRYLIFNRPIRPGLLGNRVTWAYHALDAGRMAEAATHLIGEHDFSSYRALECQARSPMRTVYSLAVCRQGDLVLLDIEANAFLHHMVRNIAGVLMTIGAGEAEPIWAWEVLAHRDRRRGGITAPPHGLYLMQVIYPEHFAIPSCSGPGMLGPL